MLGGRLLIASTFLLALLAPCRRGWAAPNASVGCPKDAVPWNGGCFDRYQWDADEKTCPDGVIVIPEGADKPRCVRCEDYDGMQQPMNFCSDMLAGQADAKLNERFQEVLKRFPEREAKLHEEQKAWSKNREKTCRRKESQFEGGSMASEVYTECLRDKTRKRAGELGRTLGLPSEAEAKATLGCAGSPAAPTPVDRRAAVVVDKSRFQSEPKACPSSGECSWLRKGYLLRGDEVQESSLSGDFACVTFKKTSGWLPRRDLCEAGAGCSASQPARPAR